MSERSAFGNSRTSVAVLAVFALLVICASSTSTQDASEFTDFATSHSVFSSALWSQELTTCSNPNTATCSWYTSCMERSVPCGPTGYVLEFGFPYCKKFGAAKHLSPLGQQWKNKTMICLQQSLVPMLGASGPLSEVCPEIASVGFASHVHCYVSEPSVCSLPWSDLFSIIDIIGPKGLLDPVGWKQTVKVAGICACQWFGLC